MKRYLLILFMLVVSGFAAVGQEHRSDKPGRERIHAAKMAYITDRIHLTAAQAGSFIPVYNEYEQEVRALRKSYRDKYLGDKKEAPDEPAVRQYVDDNLDYQQQVLDIKKRYQDRFLKVLSQQQLADLYEAEREFKKILLQRLKENGGGRMGEPDRWKK